VEFFFPWGGCRIPRRWPPNQFFHVGDHLLAIHQDRAEQGIWLSDTESPSLINLKFGHVAGPVVHADRVRNLQIKQLVARPQGAAWRSANDAIWVHGYGGRENLIDGMSVEGLTDDFMNWHTHLMKMYGTSVLTPGHAGVSMPAGTDICIKILAWWEWASGMSRAVNEVAWAFPGDIVYFYTDDGMRLAQAEFRSREHKPIPGGVGKAWYACFRELVAASVSSVADMIKFGASSRWMPDEGVGDALVVRDVSVRNCRSRGMVKGSNTLIENVTMVDGMMTGISVVAEGCFWGEGTPASNVTIRDSTFDNVATYSHYYLGAIEVWSQDCGHTPTRRRFTRVSERRVFKNISIENVVIRNQRQTGVFAVGVDGMSMRNVTFSNVAKHMDPRMLFNLDKPLDPPGRHEVFTDKVTRLERE